MRRTLIASALPVAAVSAAWLRLEEPGLVTEAAVVAVVAVLPALAPWRWLRAVAVAAATAIIAWLALAAPVWELLPFRDERVVDPLVDVVERGIGDYYGVVLPFVPERHPEMHALLLLAIFGFCAAVALLVASRMPLAAAAVTVAGVAWPATLMGDAAVGSGALALAAALSIFLGLRASSARALAAGAIAGALVVVGAVWASSASTFARDSMLAWEHWDFRGLPAKAVGVRFVWDANYDGISFPPTRTVVLEIRGPEQPQYWRASTLETFTADRWFEPEVLPIRMAEGPQGPVPRDPLTPRRALDSATWLEQRVEVKALVDDRLIAAGTPVQIDAPTFGSVFFLAGGAIRNRHPVRAGARYRMWSYVPDPSPRVLESAPARYPATARRFLEVWGRSLPPYEAADRNARMRALFADADYPAFGAYLPLYEEALRVVGGARSPYSSVLALESWFRQSGGFRYEERPPRAVDRPPLVHFVTVSRSGYCQHYAGSMALMLRLLGIPSRVAVGFTSGTHKDGVWSVTDHNAHAWVEVWFPEHGWVAFDPTPGRGRFAGIYSFASENAAAVAALRRGDLRRVGPEGLRGSSGRGTTTASRNGESDAPSLIGLAAISGIVIAAAIGAVKWAVRRARYLTSDPRRTATASRRELEAFLRDQGVAVPASATLDDLRHAVWAGFGLDGASFAEAAGQGRFGAAPEAVSAARKARRELRFLIAAARRELSLWARLRGFVSLRSLRGWQG
jgi:transglutaminase-like putative cysteine protease